MTGPAGRDQVLDRYARHVNKSLASNVLRLTPPAILDAADLDWLGHALTSAAKHVSRIMPAAA